MATKYKDRKGVTIIHLFNEEWRIGKLVEKTGKDPHVVIYAPDDKQYHAYGADVWYIFDALGDGDGYHDISTVDRAKAKIWILVNVLDDPDFWNFNMHTTPEKGIPVKVIYENGTIKWIDEFKGDWETHKWGRKIQIPTVLNPEWERNLGNIPNKHSQFIWKDTMEYKEIVAWRIKGNKK